MESKLTVPIECGNFKAVRCKSTMPSIPVARRSRSTGERDVCTALQDRRPVRGRGASDVS